MIERFQLNVVRDRVAIAATLAAPIESVAIALVDQPGCILHIGHGDPGYPILQEGQTWEFDPPWTDGLFLSTPATGVGNNLDVSYTVRTYKEPQPVVAVERARAPMQAGRFVDQLLRNFGLKR